MPINFRENQYNGINAHLHSFLQRTGGGWQGFHNLHIAHLTGGIDSLLPQQYYILNEDSLQLTFVDFDLPERRSSQTRADISVYGKQETLPLVSSGTSATPTATFPILETRIEEEPLRALVIYEQTENDGLLP